MASLPLIVGLGGINAAGRSSGFHSYKRMIESALSDEQLALTARSCKPYGTCR